MRALEVWFDRKLQVVRPLADKDRSFGEEKRQNSLLFTMHDDKLNAKNTVFWGMQWSDDSLWIRWCHCRPEMCVKRDTAVAELSIHLLLLYKTLQMYFHLKAASWAVKGGDET